jgi:hypothetical protein
MLVVIVLLVAEKNRHRTKVCNRDRGQIPTTEAATLFAAGGDVRGIAAFLIERREASKFCA